MPGKPQAPPFHFCQSAGSGSPAFPNLRRSIHAPLYSTMETWKRPVLRSYVKRHRMIGFPHQPVHLLILHASELRPLLPGVRSHLRSIPQCPSHPVQESRAVPPRRSGVPLRISPPLRPTGFGKRLSLRLLGWRGHRFPSSLKLRLDRQTRQSLWRSRRIRPST